MTDLSLILFYIYIYYRLLVLLLIRRGLNKLNNQLRKVIKLIPECEEWERDSMDTRVCHSSIAPGPEILSKTYQKSGRQTKPA